MVFADPPSKEGQCTDPISVLELTKKIKMDESSMLRTCLCCYSIVENRQVAFSVDRLT